MDDKKHLRKRILFFCAILPLISIVLSTALWVDSRYIHRTIADVRNISLQIQIIDLAIAKYEQKMDEDGELTATERRLYDISVNELTYLQEERKRLIGLINE